MDTVGLEALVGVGCVALVLAMQRRGQAAARPVRAVPALRRLIRTLPDRHRRAARAIADLANQCLDRHPHGSFEAFTAAETLQTYLPETITAFLTVPPGYRRERRHGRPSADDEVRRQFETLHDGLRRIAEADALAGSARLSANGAFLDERFGRVPEVHPRPRDLGATLADRFAEFIRR